MIIRRLIKLFAILILILFYNTLFSQNNEVVIKNIEKSSKVSIVQGNIVHVYNLNISAELNKFIIDLRKLSTDLDIFFSEILKQQKEFYAKTSKSLKNQSNKIDNVPQKTIELLLGDQTTRTVLELNIKIKDLESQKNEAILQLEKYKIENPDDTSVISLAYNYISTYNIAEFNNYINNIISNEKNKLTNKYALKGKINSEFGYNQVAFSAYKEAHKLDQNNQSYIIECLRLARMLGRFDETMYFFNIADTTLTDCFTKIELYKNFAYALNLKHKPDSAIIYFDKALEILERCFKAPDTTLDFNNLFYISIGIAKSYIQKNDQKKAELYLRIAKDEINNNKIDSISRCLILKRIVEVYKEKWLCDSVEKYAYNAISILNKLENKLKNIELTGLYQILGDCSFQNKKYYETISLLKKSINSIKEMERDTHPILFQSYEGLGYCHLNLYIQFKKDTDFKLASKYLKKAILVHYRNFQQSNSEINKIKGTIEQWKL